MKKFTKFASLFLAVVMLIGVMALPANAADLSGEFGNLAWQYDAETKTLTISGEGEMLDFAYDSKLPWYDYTNGLESIVSIVIEDGVTSIGAYAFSSHPNLESVSIPESVQEINAGAFRYCDSLTNVTLPDGVKYIAQYLFQGCASLETVSMPDSIEEIQPSAFSRCTSLKDLILPAALTTIEKYAFSGDASLDVIHLPANVSSIAPTAFNHCTAIKEFNVDAGNSNYTSVDGVLYNKDMSVLVFCPAMMSGTYAVSDKTCGINDYAFNYCASLTEVILPYGLEKIGSNAFKGCAALGDIEFPSTLKAVGAGAFYDCDSMSWMNFPDSVERLGGGIALDCDNLTDATILNSACVFEGNYTFDEEVRIHGYAGSTAETYAKSHGNSFVEMEKPDDGFQFDDVRSGTWYYDAVVWAIENGITAGTSATTFSPNADCTRAQVVTLLWRAAGSPEPETTSNPFTDVSSSAYYDKAVLWAVENNITAGTSATTFSPDAICTRAQIVTLLWRFNGSPETSGTNPFEDVKAGSFYEEAVLWAAETGVTAGTSETTFSPEDTCTRAQVVVFLYRCSK